MVQVCVCVCLAHVLWVKLDADWYCLKFEVNKSNCWRCSSHISQCDSLRALTLPQVAVCFGISVKQFKVC